MYRKDNHNSIYGRKSASVFAVRDMNRNINIIPAAGFRLISGDTAVYLHSAGVRLRAVQPVRTVKQNAIYLHTRHRSGRYFDKFFVSLHDLQNL